MTDEIKQTQLTVSETENTITLGAASWDNNFRDRINYDRQNVLTQAITAWRSNPIARRIIEIQSEFVIGDGLTFTAPRRYEKILREFWDHPLNRLDEQLPEWCDEAWRTGDLFLLVSVSPANTCFVRAIPAESITIIETATNDYRQEKLYKKDETDDHPWPAYEPQLQQDAFVLHFPLNRAVGASFGESDLAPILYWIGLYRQWLEDRARLNYFRQVFSFVLQRPFTSQAEKESYMRSFANRMPKQSGGVIGLDPSETLEALNPQLASNDANEDGLAIKRMIAAGAGIPLHYLAEPESSTRTTAESAGTPTFKRFKRRQQYLVNVLEILLNTVINISRRVRVDLPVNPSIEIVTSDITERDNANLAIAVQRVVSAFAPLYNAKLINTDEFIRLVYRFVGETKPDEVGDFALVNTRGGGSNAPGTSQKDPNEPQPEPDKADREA